MPNRYELLVFDLDGTLIDRRLQFAPRVLELLEQLRSQGVKSTIATGRILKAASRYIEQLKLKLPVILYNGAVIIDPATEQVLAAHGIPRAQAHKALELSEGLDLNIELYRDPREAVFYVERITPLIEAFMAKDGIQAVVVNDLRALLQDDPVKFLIIADPGELRRYHERLLREQLAATLVFSEWNFFEILPPRVSKGTALVELCNILGVPLERTVAFGDNMNDAEMIECAGLGVAMATSPPELQQRADLVADSLAEVLEELSAGH